MQIFDFLNNRKIGGIQKEGFYSSYSRLNLDSLISRLACQEKDVYTSMGESGVVPPFACKFRKDKYRDLLAVANEDGEVMLIDSDGGEGILKSFTAHHNAIFDICWLPDKNHLITASGDHRACLWDMNTCQMISSFRNHIESIKSVDVCPNDTALFATGSRDGTICVWDTRDKCLECGNSRDKPSISIKNAHTRKFLGQRDKKRSLCNKAMSSVSAVAFQDNLNLASSGIADGAVKIWDLRKTYISKPTYIPSPHYQMKYMDGNSSRHGCTSLVFDSTYKTLYGCSTADKIFMFDCHAYTDAVCTYKGFRCDTYFVKLALSPDDQYLVCGSSNRKAYIWKTTKPGSPIVELPAHNSEVTAVTWGSHDVTKLVTCGDDNKVIIWKTINDQNPKQLEYCFSKASVYQSSEDSREHDHSSPNSVVTDSTSHSTPLVKTPTMKSITSFFQPMSSPATLFQSPASSSSSISSVHRNEDNVSAQVLSPSKILNPNISVSPSDSSLPNSKSHGKENQLGHSSNNSLSDQTKRKSSSNESTPKFQKTSQRGKQNSQTVKKEHNSEGSITNYFSLSLSPKE